MRTALLGLRVGIGLVWLLNLLYVLDPQNAFVPTFAATASSFDSTTLGGPGLPTFVAAHAEIFAALVAGTTGYLALAFLIGRTVRWACAIGFVFNLLLLITQFGQVATVPGGTDIGPQPLYLLVYVTLYLAADRSVGVPGGLRALDAAPPAGGRVTSLPGAPSHGVEPLH